MPLTTPQISATQSIAYPNLITLTDDSIGSDGTLTNRKISIRLADGTYLANGLDWPYADAQIVLDILTQSTAPEITITWLAGSTVVYTFTDTFDFNLYDYIFALGLLSDQTGDPGVIQDSNYYSNFMKFIVNLVNSENAILYGGDIYSAQGQLNLNQQMILNESKYF
jgi:hypothetical protein